MKICERIWKEFNEDKIFKKSLKMDFFNHYMKLYIYTLKDLEMKLFWELFLNIYLHKSIK